MVSRPVKVHLVRKGWTSAACGLRHPSRRTTNPRRVTCESCRSRTLQLAAAAGRAA